MDEQSVDRPSRQRLVVAIRFKPGGLTYEFDPAGMQLHPDDRVVVETERGACWASWPRRPTSRDGRRPLDRVVKKADARDLMRHDRELQRDGELTRAVLAALGARTAECKLVKVEGTRRRQQGHRIPRRRGTPRGPRPGPDPHPGAPDTGRDQADRRPGRCQGGRRARGVRPRAMLLIVAQAVPARFGEDGEGAGAGAQPVQAGGPVRAPQVLPALRVPDLPRAQARSAGLSARRWRA